MKRAKSEAIAIARHINTFLNIYSQSLQSRSSHTLRSYQYALSLFIGFLETEKGIHPENLCGDCFCRVIIEEWLQWLLTQRGCSPETCNNRLASLRSFLKYLSSREVSLLHLSESASRIPRKRETKKKVQGISKNAVKALLVAPDISTKTGRRDLVLMITIYSTAARIDEILSLKIEHIHLDVQKPYVTIVGKGNKLRTLYLLPKAVAHLKKYIAEFHGNNFNAKAYLFYSRNSGPYGKLSQTAVNKRLKIHAKVAHETCCDVPLNLHAHQFRHAKASHWLEDGMNIVQISFLLGHEQIQTTMIYLDITTEQEAKALATLEDDNDNKVIKKWKTPKGGLAEFCGVIQMKK